MKLPKIRWIGLMAAAFLALTCGTGWNARQLETDNIHLRGSGNVAIIAEQVAEKFMREHPGTVVTVSSTGTMRGLKSLIDATCNVAMASADSDEAEEKRAKDNAVTLVGHVIGHDALAPIVHPGNSVSNLTKEQLRKIFAGEFVNWQQVGGADEAIIVLSHDGASGNYETWKDKVMQEGKIVTPKAQTMASGAMRDYVRQHPGAIGYLGLSYIDSATKTLAVDGITASQDNVKNGKFPIVRDLKLFTTQHTTAPINKFVDYFLAAEQGQIFVKQAGIIPVK